MATLVLGIDPGTRKTGYGLLKLDSEITCLDCGVMEAKAKDLKERLSSLQKDLESLLDLYKPQDVAVERIFLGKNPLAAFHLGHMVALCLLESQKRGMSYFEYPTRSVKKAVSLGGNASKEMVAGFVKNRLNLKKDLPLDTTDALAVALCHIQEMKKTKLE